MVELRHDTIVRGTLTEADDEMNLIMENASYEPLQAGRIHALASRIHAR